VRFATGTVGRAANTQNVIWARVSALIKWAVSSLVESKRIEVQNR